VALQQRTLTLLQQFQSGGYRGQGLRTFFQVFTEGVTRELTGIYVTKKVQEFRGKVSAQESLPTMYNSEVPFLKTK